MTPEVANAIEEIRKAVPDCPLVAREDGEGGAYVIIDGVPLGPPYVQETTWAGFHITFQYPYSDVYPLFVRGDLSRLDGRPLGDATSQTTYEQRPAIQLSRRSNKRNPEIDTALVKLNKVMHWLLARP